MESTGGIEGFSNVKLGGADNEFEDCLSSTESGTYSVSSGMQVCGDKTSISGSYKVLLGDVCTKRIDLKIFKLILQ